jgi:hypothetical protein
MTVALGRNLVAAMIAADFGSAATVEAYPDRDLAEAPVPGASGGTSMMNAIIIAEGEKCSPVLINIVDTAGVVVGSALRYMR